MDWKQKMLDLVPERIHPLMRGGYYTAFPSASQKDKTAIFQSSPNKLPNKHISDITVLPDRDRMLEDMPKKGRVAELGVDKGDFSEKILSKTNPEKLYLIDVWGSEKYNEDKMKKVKNRFSEEIGSDQVDIIRKRSEVALSEFEDDSFDWLYIDTTHSYEQTKRELEVGRRKVKECGVIAGHDYCQGKPRKRLSYGVIPAVHEFCVKYDWNISHLTLETHGHRSFALSKSPLGNSNIG